MIHQNTYLNAAMTAKELSAKGIHLTTRPACVLGELLDASTSFQSPKTTDAPSVLLRPVGAVNPTILRSEEELAGEVKMITANGDEPSIHSLRISALAADIAPYITAHISHARSVVVPLVVDLAQKLEKFKEAAKPNDPASSFEIVKGKIPGLLLDESFMADGIEQYASIEARYPDYVELSAEQTEDFINGLVSLGNDRLNGLVADWLKGKEKDFVKNCYLVNFTTSGIPGSYVNNQAEDYSLSNSNRGIYRTMDVGLACYLIANRLFKEPQPVQGVSLAAYKEKIRGYIDYAGSVTMKAAKTAMRQQEAGTIVSEAILSKKRVVVNNVNYQAWLEAGGSPEVLLGMLVSGEIQYSVAAIDENKERLLRHWQNYLMLAQADVTAELNKRFRDYLESEVILGLNDLTESEKDYAGSTINLKEQIAVKVKAEIEKMSHCLMDDLYHTALHLIAKARFYYTSSYQILAEIEKIGKQNPDMDVREAALLSVIDYIADYLAAQIETVK